MKKISTILLAGMLAASQLFGCGVTTPADTSAPTNETSGVKPAESTTAPEKEPAISAAEYSKGYTDEGYIAGVTALDHVKLPDFSAMELEYSDIAPDDETVVTAIYYFIKSELSYKDTESAVQDKDTVNIDYVGYIDGEEFSGGSTEGRGTEVTIGVTNYIDDFLEQLIGHKPGETFDVNVTFPDNYGKKELQGKDAKFVTTINHVMKTPEFNEELIEENRDAFDAYFGIECDSINTLIGHVTRQLYNQKLSENVDNRLKELMDDFNAPDEALKVARNQMEISVRAYYNQSLEDFAAESGYSETELQNMIEDEAKYLMLYQAIAEQNDWHITEEEIRAEYGDQTEEYLNSYGSGYVCEYFLYTKAIDHILTSIQILNVPETPAAAESEETTSEE